MQNKNFALASHFFVHFLVVFHDYDMKMPKFTFYGEPKQATTKFYFSSWRLGYDALEFNFRRAPLHFTKEACWNNCDKDAVASSDLKVPIGGFFVSLVTAPEVFAKVD